MIPENRYKSDFSVIIFFCGVLNSTSEFSYLMRASDISNFRFPYASVARRGNLTVSRRSNFAKSAVMRIFLPL